MKLYTEEQVRHGISMACSEYDYEQILELLSPIELPNDVEVGKIVLGNYPLIEHRDSSYLALGAMRYNKWLKEQILRFESCPDYKL